MTEAEGRFRERRSAHATGEAEAGVPPAGTPPEPEVPPAGGAEASASDRTAGDRKPRVESPWAGRPSPTEPQTPARERPPFPEGAFLDVIQYVVLRASQCLGEIPLDDSGDKRFLPREAKGYIDLLMLLREKTREDLSAEAADALDNVLSDLRMRYLELA